MQVCQHNISTGTKYSYTYEALPCYSDYLSDYVVLCNHVRGVIKESSISQSVL